MVKILKADAHGMVVQNKKDVDAVVKRILHPSEIEQRKTVAKIKAAFAKL